MLVTGSKTVPVAAFWTRVQNGRVQSLALVEGKWRVIHDAPLAEGLSVVSKAAEAGSCPVEAGTGHGREKVRMGIETAG